MIVKKSNKYEVRSKKGKLLGSHSTRSMALKQLRAVEINKKRKK